MPWIDAYRAHAIFVAYIKAVLMRAKLPPDEQLNYLRAMDDCPRFTPEIVRAIEPASGPFLQIVHEAMATDDPGDEEFMHAALRGGDIRERYPAGRPLVQRSAAMLTTDPVWSTLTRLNPSLLKAMRLIGGERASA